LCVVAALVLCAVARADTPGQVPAENASTARLPDSAIPLGGSPTRPASGSTKDASKSQPADAVSDSPWRTIGSLSLVVAMIVAAGWGLRVLARRHGGLVAGLSAGGRAPAGLLEVLGRYPVGRGQTLVLLKLDRRVLLLSQSAGIRGGSGFRTLCEVTDPDEVASILVKSRDAEGESLAARFRMLLSRADRDVEDALVGVEPMARGVGHGRREIGTDDRAELWDDAEVGRDAVGSLRERLSRLRESTVEGGAR
jgi:flagellar biogenesis protein FliO